MKYQIGQPVWVRFARETPPSADGWYAGTIVGYSTVFPGKYLAEVPEIPFHHMDPRGEGYWRPKESGLKPRDEPKEQKREELGDWDLCPWHPERVTVSET